MLYLTFAERQMNARERERKTAVRSAVYLLRTSLWADRRRKLADLLVAGSDAWLEQADESQIGDLLMVAERKRLRGRDRPQVAIELRGVHAEPPYDRAFVDEDDWAILSRYAWKAKPNGTGKLIYAVRATPFDGAWIDVRMHREVLGVRRFNGLDVDHMDRRTLNNSMSNLRLATRSQNVMNRAGTPPLEIA